MGKNNAVPTPAVPEDENLERRVEIIMGEKNLDGVTPAGQNPTEQPAIDIFHDPKTAPAVTPEVLQNVSPNEVVQPTEPAIPEQPAVPTVEEVAPAAEPVPVDDVQTEKAVSEISHAESDSLLQAEDEQNASDPKNNKVVQGGPGIKFYRKRWFWISATILLLIAAVFAIPQTRYMILGTFIKKQIEVQVVDSTLASPVSGAAVTVSGQRAKTNGNGAANVTVPVGSATITVTKQYYKNFSGKTTVTLKSNQKVTIKLVATGRQVPISVADRVTGQPLADVEISGDKASATTDKNGHAVLVVPASESAYSVTLRHNNYLNVIGAVMVTSKVVATNNFTMVAEGNIYFLSNKSGKVDVVKTNLSGGGRTVVLAGTGKEDQYDTQIIASSDWRYVVLKAKRDTPQAGLYIIDTTTDKVTNFDTGDASFGLIGWHGHTFVYTVSRNNTSLSTSGSTAIKSYDADKHQLNVIDQNTADGSGSFGYQTFSNIIISGDQLAYGVTWATTNGYSLTGKSAYIRSYNFASNSKKDLQTFDATKVVSIYALETKPDTTYFGVYGNDFKTSYYALKGSTVSEASDGEAVMSKGYPAYLSSESGSKNAWSETRDGKPVVVVGDSAGNQATVVNETGLYQPIGWYGDDYLIVTSKDQQLYLISSKANAGTAPAQVTDYLGVGYEVPYWSGYRAAGY